MPGAYCYAWRRLLMGGTYVLMSGAAARRQSTLTPPDDRDNLKSLPLGGAAQPFGKPPVPLPA